MVVDSSRSAAWVSWYSNQFSRPGILSGLSNKPLSFFDGVPKAYVSNEPRLVSAVATHEGTCFIMVPTKDANVKLMHQPFVFSETPEGELSVFGICGPRSSSPFKKINTRLAVLPLSPPTVTTRGGVVHKIPSLDQFLGVEDADDFANLNGGPDETDVSELGRIPCSWWFHSRVFIALDGVAGGRAADLGYQLAQTLVEAASELEGEHSLEESGYHTLIFLWAVEKGFATPSTLGDIPDSDDLDDKCQSIQRKLLRGGPTDGGTGEPSSDGAGGSYRDNSGGAGGTAGGAGGTVVTEERQLNQRLIQNLTSMTEATLESTRREEKRKSMKANLAPDDEEMFTLLCAKDWQDDDPKISDFMEKVLSDKNVQRALGLFRNATIKWKGVISAKGLTKFLASGYSALDVDESPGGLSIFMCHPLKKRNNRTDKEIQSEIKSIFGDGKLSEEMVKHFAKDDFFLPHSLYELENMINLQIDLTELVTIRHGIASEGYRYGLDLLSDNWEAFLKMTDDDPLFPIKFAYLLDKAFQIFVTDLKEYCGRSHPIRDARRQLRDSMRNGIDSALRGFRYGAVPNLFLPAVLSSPSKLNISSNTEDDRKVGATPAERPSSPTSAAQQAWWAENPSPVKEWCLPTGRTYGSYFNASKPKLKANSSGWLKFAHHKTGVKRPLCMRYQCVGKCRVNCSLAHVKPADIEKKQRDDVTVRLQAIYSGEEAS